MQISKRTILASAIGAAAMLLMTFATPAAAYSQLSCGQLWYERNRIYAEYGYCFQTQQAIATFGRRCHPPYGRLPPHAQAQVNAIVGWERRRGCN